MRRDSAVLFSFWGFFVVCYLNRAIILEQAIVSVVNDYFDTLKFDNLYNENYHIKATLDHPFAQIFKTSQTLNAADLFPAVVVSTYDDGKPPDLDTLRPQVQGIKLKQSDIDQIVNVKEKIIKDGKEKERNIPGLCTVVAPEVLQTIKEHITKKGEIIGFVIRAYRRDKISLDIWTDNTQLKNEIYKQLLLFTVGNLRHILTAEKYQVHDIKIDDDTIIGQPSGAYNDQFDQTLTGGSINFDVTYAVEQIVLDTAIDSPSKDIVKEVIIHVEA